MVQMYSMITADHQGESIPKRMAERRFIIPPKMWGRNGQNSFSSNVVISGCEFLWLRSKVVISGYE